MANAKRTLAREWLVKARHDLESAHKLAEGSDPFLDTAVYHCQQGAEKALKGWLLYRDQRFEKTHDLLLLITLAAALESSFNSLQDDAELLTPYATAFRYPDEFSEPSQEEFSEALKAGERVYCFVLKLQPELEVNGA